ncbi:DUF4134 domain-containing protein [Mucilaginibacter sp. Bleaf8]|uniref:DUF4134 family protein n=1 Tax=Mucilaginibacter sp. Bleaf8 TaxID=2834430 RepID=UPI001BCBDEFC|nr:DUF4134 family protein [Mucilaginibacter sp. Bleaf8]MBS7565558.1 DUF4134 domain-containing protein [Mucilaginibacter sp. Bleaf8]
MRRTLTVISVLLPAIALAQPGIAEMQQAEQNISSSFFPAYDCALVIAVLLGTMGALRIYHNWQMGRDRMDAAVAAWFFSALFMTLCGPFLKALFGI